MAIYSSSENVWEDILVLFIGLLTAFAYSNSIGANQRHK